MAKKNIKAKAGLKWKKKKWYSIEAPSSFGGKVIAETLSEDSSIIKGRILHANMMQLAGNIKKQNLVVGLKIEEIVNNVAKTIPIDFEMQTASIRRLVRKATSNIEESFCCITKDEKKVRIKPIAITRNKVNSGVTKAVRRVMIPTIVREAKKLTFEELIVGLTSFEFQKEVKKKMDKAYPLKTFQIKYAGLERARKVKVVEETEEPETEEEENIEEISEEKEVVAEV